MTYLISYDLNTPGKDYIGLYKAIETASNGTCCKPLRSVYVIKSSFTAQAIYNMLAPYIDQNDDLIILEVTANGHVYLDPDATIRLKDILRLQP